MPFAAVTFVIASVASMGLPGFSGFVAELQVLIGAWQAFPTLAVVAGLGILIGVAYTLRALQKAFFRGAQKRQLQPCQTARRHAARWSRFRFRNGSARCCLIGTSLAHRALPAAAAGSDLAELWFAAL